MTNVIDLITQRSLIEQHIAKLEREKETLLRRLALGDAGAGADLDDVEDQLVEQQRQLTRLAAVELEQARMQAEAQRRIEAQRHQHAQERFDACLRDRVDLYRQIEDQLAPLASTLRSLLLLTGDLDRYASEAGITPAVVSHSDQTNLAVARRVAFVIADAGLGMAVQPTGAAGSQSLA